MNGNRNLEAKEYFIDKGGSGCPHDYWEKLEMKQNGK
jgi:hypothetical protein